MQHQLQQQVGQCPWAARGAPKPHYFVQSDHLPDNLKHGPRDSKHLFALLDLDDTLTNAASSRDIQTKIKAQKHTMQQELLRTADPQQQARIKSLHEKITNESELHLSLVKASQAHYEAPNASDPKALEARLNAAALTHLTPDELTKRNLWFTAQEATTRLQFHDATKEYRVIAAHACGGEVMVCRVPHQLEGHWVLRFQAEQKKIRAAFLTSLGGGTGPVNEDLLTAEQQTELHNRLSAGCYECYHDMEWLQFAADSRQANSAWNHIITVVPTGLVRLIDGMAAAKRSFEAAGGSFTAHVSTCNKRLALVATVLQLQIDPCAEVFDEGGIQLHSGHGLKTLRGGSWKQRRGMPAAGVQDAVVLACDDQMPRVWLDGSGKPKWGMPCGWEVLSRLVGRRVPPVCPVAGEDPAHINQMLAALDVAAQEAGMPGAAWGASSTRTLIEKLAQAQLQLLAVSQQATGPGAATALPKPAQTQAPTASASAPPAPAPSCIAPVLPAAPGSIEGMQPHPFMQQLQPPPQQGLHEPVRKQQQQQQQLGTRIAASPRKTAATGNAAQTRQLGQHHKQGQLLASHPPPPVSLPLQQQHCYQPQQQSTETPQQHHHQQQNSFWLHASSSVPPWSTMPEQLINACNPQQLSSSKAPPQAPPMQQNNAGAKHSSKRDRLPSPREDSQQPTAARQQVAGCLGGSSTHIHPIKREHGSWGLAPAAAQTASKHEGSKSTAQLDWGLAGGSGRVTSKLQASQSGHHNAAEGPSARNALAPGLIGVAMAAHTGQHHTPVQQGGHQFGAGNPQQQQVLVLRGDPFQHLADMPQRLQEEGITSRQILEALQQMEQQGLCQSIYQGSGTRRDKCPQLQRLYVLHGFRHITRDSREAAAVEYSNTMNRSTFIRQHKAGAGCLGVRVTGPRPDKARSTGPAESAAAAAALQDKLNLHSLVLLAWRLQHELAPQLGWLAELLSAGTAAETAAAASRGTASQQQARSDLRRQLDGTGLHSTQQ